MRSLPILVLLFGLPIPLLADPPSDDAASAWSTRLEAAVNDADVGAFDAQLGAGEIFDDAVAGVDAEPKQKADFRNAFLSTSMGAQLCQAVEAGGAYKLLRLRAGKGETEAVFRLLTPDGGMNYHVFRLVKAADGTARVKDMYIYLFGDTLGAIAKRAFLQAKAIDASQKGGKLGGWEKDFVDSLPAHRRMQKAMGEERWKDALKEYESMPRVMREEKLVMVERLLCAMRVEEATYQKALDDWKTLFPDDPSLDLKLIDAHAMKGENEKVIECAERLSASLGGDPYLAAMKAGYLSNMGKLDDAKVVAKGALADEPSLANAWFVYLDVVMKQKDYAGVTQGLLDMEKGTGAMALDVENAEEFEEWRKAGELEKWKKAREGK